MDPLSHGLLGFVLGQALGLDGNAQIILILSSVVLDIDAISIPGWEASFRFHRGPLHSILGAILASLTISTAYTALLRFPATVFMPILLVCLGGSFSHVFLDLLTIGNVAVLWPFSSKRVAFDLTHFVDPIFFAVLLPASILTVHVSNEVKVIYMITIVAIVLLTVNFGLRYYERDAAIETIKGLNDADFKIVPLPTFRPDRWWVAAKKPFENGYRYEIYKVDSIGNKILSHSTVESPFVDYRDPAEPPIDSSQKAIACSKRDNQVSAFIEKSRLPAVNATLLDNGKTWHVFWYDLFTQLSERVSRGIIVKVHFNGRITQTSWHKSTLGSSKIRTRMDLL